MSLNLVSKTVLVQIESQPLAMLVWPCNGYNGPWQLLSAAFSSCICKGHELLVTFSAALHAEVTPNWRLPSLVRPRVHRWISSYHAENFFLQVLHSMKSMSPLCSMERCIIHSSVPLKVSVWQTGKLSTLRFSGQGVVTYQSIEQDFRLILHGARRVGDD